jgi:hypothetical protein
MSSQTTPAAAEPAVSGTSPLSGLRGQRLYPVLAGLVTIVAVVLAVRQPWSADFGVHAATVERLRESLTHPGNPLVDVDGPSPYYSPYPLLLGLLARVTGLSAVTMLAIAGPLIVVLLLWGLRAFVRTLSDRPLAPVLALVFVLVLWGFRPRVWSGFFSLWALPFVTAFPSTLALALTLLFWAGLSRTLDGPVRWLRYLGLGVLGALVALIHPFTMVPAVLGALGLVAVRARRLPRAAWLGLAAATVEAAGCLAVWPYYSYTALLRASAELDAIHRPLYDRPWLYYGLILVALPALWRRWRRARLDPLVLLFVGSAVLVALGWLTGRYALGRVWPAVLLSGQLALAVELAGPLSRTVARRWIPVTAIACLVGAAVQASNLLYLVPRPLLTPGIRTAAHVYLDWPTYSWLVPYTHPRDVLLTNDFHAVRVVGAYGIYTVAPAWPDPLLDDEAQRRQDLATLVRPTTDRATRAALLARYHVRWILEVPGKWAPVDGRTPVATGPDGQRLYAV